MKYIGLKQTEITYGSAIVVRRDLSFIITDPGRWNTMDFLKLLARKAGGVIQTVTLFSTYHKPDGTFTHTYHLDLHCKSSGSKTAWMFPIEKVNDLMHEIELEMEQKLPVRFLSYHKKAK